ncbi:MAG: hypothetical protein GX542_11695 [Rhodococcus sp.]|nr:hypothetical protein [Rhodococcus sp. (in: high G+C Gram-positive bacteria)]
MPSTQPQGMRIDASAPAPTTESSGIDRREIREFAGSTPARLTAVGVVLLLLALASGVVTVVAVNNRESTLQTLLSATEPLANSAQNLYSALSVADAAATTAFISRGLEPREVRERYLNAVATASTELVYATAGLESNDVENARLLAAISSGLTTYSGLVETARANNRVGNPVGSAYLGEASTLMQHTVLPMAQELHANQERRVFDTQRAYAQPPWLTIVLLLASVGSLLAAQILMTRHSRRTLNSGLIAASAASASLLIWLMVAGMLSAVSTGRALSHGAVPLHELTDARITAQQVRAAETLKLVRRDGEISYDEAYREKSAHLTELLESYPPSTAVQVALSEVEQARTAWSEWESAHIRMDALLESGDHAGAAAIAVGTGPADAPGRFDDVDSALTAGIIDARGTLRARITSASNVLGGLTEGAVLLTVIGAGAIVAGLRPRLREYR